MSSSSGRCNDIRELGEASSPNKEEASWLLPEVAAHCLASVLAGRVGDVSLPPSAWVSSGRCEGSHLRKSATWAQDLSASAAISARSRASWSDISGRAIPRLCRPTLAREEEEELEPGAAAATSAWISAQAASAKPSVRSARRAACAARRRRPPKRPPISRPSEGTVSSRPWSPEGKRMCTCPFWTPLAGGLEVRRGQGSWPQLAK
mmetsp:Transcript_104075/g.232383  ORF Transcript_104075/g.232383 Transcript_104075/m.232383 type:complete len:206 (-) Transcript_104075:18-635(-)